ncbi:MAG: hypothetical protein ACTS85_04500, partial [Arsenophonus sp. NC-PG7-MAG3]
PMLKEPFGQQVWYYIFRQQFKYNKVKPICSNTPQPKQSQTYRSRPEAKALPSMAKNMTQYSHKI